MSSESQAGATALSTGGVATPHAGLATQAHRAPSWPSPDSDRSDGALDMDFVRDTLAEGQLFRVLRVLDQWSRQSPLGRWGPRCGRAGCQAFHWVWECVQEPRSI